MSGDADRDRARRHAARALLGAAAEAVDDARLLLERDRLRGAALRACAATRDAARAFLVLRGLDVAGDPAVAAALFARQAGATGLLSPACALAVHRALRLEREAREGAPQAIYEARVRAALDGAQQLRTEADIVLAPYLDDPAQPQAPAPDPDTPDPPDTEPPSAP